MLDLRAAGFSRRQIAERLCVSEHTVKAHIANAYTELGVGSLLDALRVLGTVR